MNTFRSWLVRVPAWVAHSATRQPVLFAALMLFLVLWGGATGNPARATASIHLAIIANASVPIQSLKAAELASIFTRTTRNWKDGALIRPLNLPPGSAERMEFDRVILRMEPEQSAQYWVDRMVRGEEAAPKAIAKPEILVRLVETTSGAIGYVPHDKVGGSTRVLARIQDGKVVWP